MSNGRFVSERDRNLAAYCLSTLVVLRLPLRYWRRSLAPLALQSPHTANRHDAGCRDAGTGRAFFN